MKRALIFTLAAALPLAAGEQKKEQTDKTAEPATTATATAAAPAQPDSPLVAAMKRANRKGKKPTNLITNATLSRGGGAHITTTDNPQRTINLPAPAPPPRPTPEMVAARTAEIQKKQLAEIAEKERKAKEEQQRKHAQAAAAYEDGYDGVQDDGAEFVGSAPPPPQE